MCQAVYSALAGPLEADIVLYLRGQQKVTVIVRLRSWEAWPQIGNRPTGMVVVQPASRDTGAGMSPFQLSPTKGGYRPYRGLIIHLSNRKISASGLDRPR